MNRGALLTASGLGIGGTGGIVAFSIDYFTPKDKSIKGVLERKGIKLISYQISNYLNQKEQWKAEFKLHEDTVKDLIGYNGTDITQGGEKLKEWCEKTWKREAETNNRDLENVKKYCTIRSVKDQIQKLGKNYLDEKSNSVDWNKTFQKRNSENPNRSSLNKIQAWCKVEAEKDFFAFQMAFSFKSFYLSCTKEGGELSGTTTFSIENMKNITNE